MTEIKTRKKRDTSQKRKAILEGAVKVFTQNGFDASSMDRIAEVAGVSKRTIYNHFPSKEDLFQAIVADFLKQRDERKPIQYTSAQSLEEQLKEFAKAELFLINDPVRRGLSKLFTSVFLMDLDFGRKTRSQFEPHKAFIAWLNAAQENQKLRFQSPELAARIFYGLVEGCLTYPALFTDGASLRNADGLLDEIIATFLSRYGC
ncbi:MAG: TetR/AcrR family transcriptional regulator [Christensenella sp.]|nr:TetR/AcrR family transcriptional regulator [Christensenella sp.]